MRRILMLAMILLALTGIAGGQAVKLPPCSAAQLAVTDSYMTDHFELMGYIMTPEMVGALSPSALEDLGDLIQNESSGETLSEYGAALFTWRESFWEAHPICDDIFDIGVAMDESASDMAAFLAYQLAGVAVDDNPYVEGMRNGIGLLTILLGELPDEPTAEGDPPPVDLPACSDDDLGVLSQELAVYEALLEVPPRTYSLAGLAKYGLAQLAWRDKLWTRLPPCDLALQVGLLMSHISSDLTIELALEIGKIASAGAQFSEQIAADQARLEEIAAPIDAVDRLSAQTVTPPECGDDEMLRFAAANQDYPGLVDALKAVATVPDLLAAADKHVAWRESFEKNLPNCAGSLVTAGLMLRVTGNYVGSLALDIAGIMPQPDAEMPVKPHLFGIVTMSVIADEISGTLQASGMQPAELTAAAAGGNLPDCESSDLGLRFYNLFVEYSDLVDMADSLETVGDVMDFRQRQIDWAEHHIELLPGCKQAVVAGYMMYTILADFTAAYALLIAGAEPEDIPYAKTIWTYRDRLDAWLREELQ